MIERNAKLITIDDGPFVDIRYTAKCDGCGRSYGLGGMARFRTRAECEQAIIASGWTFAERSILLTLLCILSGRPHQRVNCNNCRGRHA